MPDLSAGRQGPFDGLRLDPPRLRSVVLEEIGPAVRFSFRGSEAAAATGGRAFGVELPRQACRANAAGSRAALWLGPDEWLLIASDPAAEAEPGRLAKELAETLEAACADVPHSLVDVSHRQAALSLAGRDAAAALNAGCPLDLSLRAFPVGMCTRTLFAKAEIVLWRTGEDRFRVEIWRSFVRYVVEWLEIACRDAAGLDRSR